MNGASQIATDFASPTIYVDGSSASPTVDTGWRHVAVTTGTGVNASALEIGVRLIEGFYFDGKLDEIRMYNRELTASEVAKLYQSGAVKTNASSAALDDGSSLASGLVGHWTFDGGDITRNQIVDRSSQGNHGGFIGGATSSATTIGKLGQGLNFDGTDDYVRVSDSTSLDILSSYTQAAWVKLTALPAGGNVATIASNGSASYYMVLANNELSCGFSAAHTTAAENLTTGVWYHVACAFDTVANTMTNYINGVQELQEGETGDPSNPASEHTIGRFPSGIQHTNGVIDDVRVYNRALSPAAVKQLYQLGTVIIRP